MIIYVPRGVQAMSESNTTPVADLLNLGPVSSGLLNAIGIISRADLERVGPVLAYRALRDLRPGVSKNLLYAMHGALLGERWDRLSEATRAELKQQVEASMKVPPSVDRP